MKFFSVYSMYSMCLLNYSSLLHYQFIYRVSLFEYLLHVPLMLLVDIDSTLQSFLHDILTTKFWSITFWRIMWYFSVMIMWQWMQFNGHFASVVTLIISTVYVQVSNGCEFASLFVSCFRGCWIAYQMFMHISCRTVFVIFPMCMTVWVLTVISV